MDQLSYAWGIAIGKQLRGMGLTDLRYDDFDRALKASFEDLPTEMEAQEAQKIITEYLEELSRKAAEAAQSVGKKFLEENGKKENVITTASGLQYEVEKEGTGAQPTAEDEVTVHYTGKLLDGTVFDSSVQLMKEGGKYRFYIPSDLAYGPNGIQGAIPPHATLIFDVELIKVIKK